MRHWLIKTEPDAFSLDDLRRESPALWDGVRNYQARNFLREMQLGDVVLIQHSSCKVPAVVGLAIVSELALPDPTASDPEHKGFDPRQVADIDAGKPPRWVAPRLSYLRPLRTSLPIARLKARPELADSHLVRRARLSVMPLSESEAACIASLAGDTLLP